MATERMMPHFSMGLNTYKVHKSLFETNRQKLLKSLRKILPEEQVVGSIVYLKGGTEQSRNDTDHEPIFRQESYFHYLFGVREPDYAGAIHIDSGLTILFIPRLPEDYATFMGHILTVEEVRQIYCVDEVMYIDEAENHLGNFVSNETPSQVFLMNGFNSDSGREYLPPQFDSLQLGFNSDTSTLFGNLAECRVKKSKQELNLIRHCTEVTSLAHVFTMVRTKPGMMEYQSESLFKHFTYYNFGARNVGYTTICGCGPDGAVLHYGHAGAPNDRLIQDGDMCLFDMGAEYFCYGSDVTCSFPANGTFTEKQKIIYEGVLNAQRIVIEMIEPGVSWVDCHKAAEGEILKALVKLGIVIDDPMDIKALTDMRLGAVFMPHGLGHLIGIDTHDVGGYLPGHPKRSRAPGLCKLRTARILEENMTITVEPGCYFIDHLIDEAINAEYSPFSAFLNADVLNQFRGFGGIRLEDVIAITADGCENYTICPRTIQEIESVKAGEKWPPLRDTAPELRRTRLTDPTPLSSGFE
jgi:Xaa-Pro dipeptidase